MSRRAEIGCISMLAFTAACSLGAHAGELLKGKVVDIGLPDDANGIAGVTVVVAEERTQKQVGDGLTDASGIYQIDLKSPHGPKLVAKFSKIGYFARPTLQAVKSPAAEQPSVKLSRESGSEAYYKAVAERLSTVYKSNPDASVAYLSAVTALPTTDKEAVFNALKAKDAAAYNNLKVADDAYQATQQFLTKYRGVDEFKGKSFNAYANYGTSGTVWLFGAVPTAENKKEFEMAIRKFPGVRNVQNDLVIAK
jgi:hypothetical protein